MTSAWAVTARPMLSINKATLDLNATSANARSNATEVFMSVYLPKRAWSEPGNFFNRNDFTSQVTRVKPERHETPPLYHLGRSSALQPVPLQRILNQNKPSMR